MPSDEFPDGVTALGQFLKTADHVSVACAFVTDAGVDRLAEALAGRRPRLEVCARGAPVTEQSALLRLRDELDATVTAVPLPRAAAYHPKLWLLRSPGTLTVLSGSGNLTGPGLTTNVEQFELLQMSSASGGATEHERRLLDLIAAGVPLDEFESSIAWHEWKTQLRERRRLAEKLRELDEVLASRKASGREHDKRLLCADLYELYGRTVAARLPRRDGKAYVPNYFKRGLDGACAANNPVPFVARMCDRQTEGFDVILDHGTADLTVEALVLDETKPYYSLFEPRTRQLAADRLKQFEP